MTRPTKRIIPKTKLRKLAKAMGGRGAIAEATMMSRAAVDRYFIGKGMRSDTYDAIMLLYQRHVDKGEPIDPDMIDEPPTLAEQGGHLFTLLVKALERNSGVDALHAQLNRMEARLQRIEENQATALKAWAMQPAGLAR